MDFIETTLSRSTAFQGTLLRLEVDAVRLPDGSEAHREVVRHPGGVAVVAVTHDRQVLLVRQFRYPYSAMLAELPAGKREPGEDPLTTGKRELEEETGYRADTWVPLGTLYPTPGCCDEVDHLFLATNLTAAEAHPDQGEFLTLEREPLDRLVAQVMAGQIPDAKTQIGILKAHLYLSQKEE